MSKTPIVLVHGAWHTSWSWEAMRPALEATGARVTTVDLPGRADPAVAATSSVADMARAVSDAIERVGEPVVLLGHSLGGVASTEAARLVPDAVAHLVYLAAFVPPAGQSVVDVSAWAEFAPSLALKQDIDPARGLTTFPADVAPEALYGDVDDALVAEAVSHLVPDGLALAMHQAAADLPPVRTSYVECLRDRAIPLAAQRRMHVAAGIENIVSLDADHSPFLSRPDDLVVALQALTT